MLPVLSPQFPQRVLSDMGALNQPVQETIDKPRSVNNQV
jgi:hypothetical protein